MECSRNRHPLSGARQHGGGLRCPGQGAGAGPAHLPLVFFRQLSAALLLAPWLLWSWRRNPPVALKWHLLRPISGLSVFA